MNIIHQSKQYTQSSTTGPVRIMHVFGRMIPGGAELRTLDVLRRCSRDDVHAEFVALSGKEGTLDDEIRAMGGDVHPLRLDWQFHKKFPALLKERKIDIVHSHVLHASGYIVRQAAKAGVPRRIVHYRNHGTAVRPGIFPKIKTIILKRMIDKYATDILAVSEAALSSCWSDQWTQDPRCDVLYNGIDLAGISKQGNTRSVKDEFGINNDKKLLIHVGNFRGQKNHVRLIQIFEEILKGGVNGHLLLVGGQDATQESIRIHEQVEAEIQYRNLEEYVTLIGTRNDVYRLMQEADLMLFPSLLEGLPGVVLEANACGLPVLASELPVIPEMQRQLSGIHACSLYSSDKQWAHDSRELLSMYQDEQKQKNLSQQFSKSMFTIDQAVERFSKLWTGRICSISEKVYKNAG